MGLSELAAGVETTVEQRDRGVATVDRTADLETRLAEFDDDLPCSPGEAATLVEAYAAGRSVGASAHSAGLAPVTGGKVLHLLGEPVNPLSPTARDVVRDWLDARLSRTDAVALAGVDEVEFALGVYIETHDPIPAARDAVEAALAVQAAPAVEAADPLRDARSGVDDLLASSR